MYTATTATAQYQWAVNSTGSGIAMGIGLTSDASNNIYVGGGYSGAACTVGGTTLAAPTNGDGFLAKYDASGTPQWAIRVAGAGDEDVKRLVTDGSNIYITGVFSGSITLYSTNATTQTLTSTGSTDCYLAKYNSSGVVQWAIKYGGAGAESPKDLAINTSLQRLYLAGTAGSSLFAASFNYSTGSSTPVWTYGSSAGTLESGGVAVDPSGNCFLLAYYASPTATITLPSGTYNGNNGSLLIKLNSSGSTTWVQNIGSSNSGEERGRNVGVDAAGNAYIAGQYFFTANISGITLTNFNATQLDVFVAKYNSAGTVQWARKLSSAANQVISAFTVSPAGDSYPFFSNGENSTLPIGCQTHSSINGSTDNKMVIAKYSTDGVVKGSLSPSIADNNGLGANSIALSGSGTIVTTGQLFGSSTFGATTLSLTADMYLAKALVVDETPTVSASSVNLCGLGSSAALSASGPAGSTIKWYMPSTTLVGTGTSYNTPASAAYGSVTYYVSSTVAGCESGKLPVTVTTYSNNQISVTPSNTTICNGSCVTVSFSNATTAVLTPGGTIQSSPFVFCPTAGNQFTLTNTGGGYCEVPGTFSVNVIITPAFAGTYSASIGTATSCTPAVTGTSKPISTSPVISNLSMPTSTVISTFRCQLANTVGWMGARSVGISDFTFIGTYTVEVYEVDNAGVRNVVLGQVAPNIYEITGTAPFSGNLDFNDPVYCVGYDPSAGPYFVDPTPGIGDYFYEYYREAANSLPSTTALTDYSAKIFCTDVRQITSAGCTINKKSYFRIANNGNANGRNGRMDTAGEEEETGTEGYKSLEVFPNPTNSSVSISLNSDDKNVQLILTDNIGRQVMKSTNLESAHGQVNMESLPAGIYFYTIVKNNTTYKGKIVKQ